MNCAKNRAKDRAKNCAKNRVMRTLVAIWIAMLAIALPTPGAAQLTCATKLGTCPIGGSAAAGGSCVCVTQSGPIQGVAQGAGAGNVQSNVPNFCCTPSGRIPFPNSSVGPGQACQATTPTGAVRGQACY